MLRSLASRLADTLADGGWRSNARPSQIPPLGDWAGWLVLAGRGFGKTWIASNFANEQAESGQARRIALIAPTAADCRDVMVEGESGILATAPAWCRPEYEPSKRKLTWPNGATALLFSAEEAERLRGPQFDLVLADELAAWKEAQAVWDMAMFCLRLGRRPRWVVTTTPKPLNILKGLLAREGRDVIVTRGSTYENAANLAPSFLEDIRARYEGTRLGRQELNAELLEDVQGALWTRDMVERARFSGTIPDLKRVVVAVDPSGTRGDDGGDSVGIVVAGLGVDDLGYVLSDETVNASPAVWGAVAVAAYRKFKADRIVAERNFGGAMVEHVIRTVNTNVPYREVTASRGKVQRAEPIASLYEQNKVRHVGAFTALEDQLCAMTGDGFAGDGSPDRADALVWALTELMTKPTTPTAVFGVYSAQSTLPANTRHEGPITEGRLAGGYAVSRR
ncbi:DNA-packaging protein [Bradyrhizobium sp. PMVTL-01]|uniref:DNA-packaging protein n=1 Tax=Bradyrhizobium sp. PMVTL-01 TaxID=3434999 RepID=UPI003F6EF4AE